MSPPVSPADQETVIEPSATEADKLEGAPGVVINFTPEGVNTSLATPYAVVTEAEMLGVVPAVISEVVKVKD